jgi:chromosome segregation ATPase
MTKELIIIALLLLVIYLYYQNKKLKGLPNLDNSSNTIYEVVDHEELIAERDQAIRSKNEAEAEVLSLSNKLRNKQSEVTRKETEIERLKKEKSSSEISLNKKISELRSNLSDLQEKYSKQGKLLDEEQTDNNKLSGQIEKLEAQIEELKRAKSPMPGEFPPQDELVKEHQNQLRAINLLFDANAKDYAEIDFNGLYELLKRVGGRIKKLDQLKASRE